MRTLLRVGGIVGGLGFVALYALQPGIALAVAAGIPCIGLLAGLGAAKWLPREWYGRQFQAGLRAGALASGVAALGALLSLLVLGPRDTLRLATASHIAGFTLAPAVRTLQVLTWVGVDVLLVLAATAVGCGLAAIASQIVGWSKSAEAIRVVQQARLAAQALNRDDAWLPLSTGAPLPGQPIHAAALLQQLGVPVLGAPSTGMTGMTGMTGAPALSSMPGPISASGMTGGLSATGAMPASGITPGLGLTPPLTFTPASGSPIIPFAQPAPASRPSVSPASPAASGSASAEAELANATEPALPTAPARDASSGQGAKQQGRRRSPSSRRRADQELTQAMRDALAAWASENADGEARTVGDQDASRTPASSAYLNSAAPAAPKRSRKKQDTRDWLC